MSLQSCQNLFLYSLFDQTAETFSHQNRLKMLNCYLQDDKDALTELKSCVNNVEYYWKNHGIYSII